MILFYGKNAKLQDISVMCSWVLDQAMTTSGCGRNIFEGLVGALERLTKKLKRILGYLRLTKMQKWILGYI